MGSFLEKMPGVFPSSLDPYGKPSLFQPIEPPSYQSRDTIPQNSVKVPPPTVLDVLMQKTGLGSHPGLDETGKRIFSPMVIGDTIYSPPKVQPVGPVAQTDSGTSTPTVGSSRRDYA